MSKEKKQELINEIVGILHENAGTMFDGKQSNDEARIALDEDYFEDVAESVFDYLQNIFSQSNRKELSGYTLVGIEQAIQARKYAVALRDLLNYSPKLIEDNVYKSMNEIMNHVLELTNDIDLSRLEDK